MKINRQNNNPLIEAYQNADIKKFRELISNGENVNCLDEFKRSLISIVVTNCEKLKNNKDFFHALLDADVMLERIGVEKGLLTICIEEHSNTYYAKELLKNNINVNSMGKIPYIGMIENTMDYTEIEQQENEYTNYESYGPPVFDALLQNKMKFFDLMLEYNADVNVCDTHGLNILDLLLNVCDLKRKEMIEAFERLLDYGVDIDVRNIDGSQIIHHIINNEKYYLLDVLFEKSKDIDINSRDNKGITALMYATANSNLKSMEFLIEKGANMDIYALDGENALSISINYLNDVRNFELLVKKGANLVLRDEKFLGHSILHKIAAIDCQFPQNPTDEYRKKIRKTINTYYKLVLEKHPELLDQKNNLGKTPVDILKRKKSYTHKKKKFLDGFQIKNKSKSKNINQTDKTIDRF